MVARRVSACCRRSAVGPRYRRLGPRWRIRVPKVVCRVLRQRKGRGEVGKSGREDEWNRGFLGGEQDGAFFAAEQRLLWRLTKLRKGDLRTSVQASERNAVTWGVFPGQEIVQSTIIEEESFLTWKVRTRIPLGPPGSLIDVATGRGVFDLDQLGVSFRTGLRGATAARGNQRYPLAGQRHTPRF